MAGIAAISGQPQLGIGIGGALAATSPRLMANMYRRILGTTAKVGKMTETFFRAGKPIADAIVSVGNRFLVAPGASTSARRADLLKQK